jgi:hypothetical protein
MKQTDKLVELGSCYFLLSDNMSRKGLVKQRTDSADRRLTVSLAGGLDRSQGNWGYRVATAKEQKAAKTTLEAKWKQLKNSTGGFEVNVADKKVTVSASDILRVFETIHVVKGKLKKVKYLADWAFRRNARMLYANAIRLVLGKELITEIPAVINEWDNEKQRIEQNILENERKTEGMLKPSHADSMAAALLMYREGLNQAAFRRTFKDGTGQKLWYLCQIDQKFPKLNITSDFVNGVEGALVTSYSPYSTKKLNGLLEKGITDSKVKEYLSNPKEGGNEPKMAQKSDIKGLAQHGVNIIRETAEAIISNDVGKVRSYNDFCEEINAAVEAIVAGKKIVFEKNAEPNTKKTKVTK